MRIEPCPNCQYISRERSAYCPVCGAQLTYPLWKKVAAGVLLVLIGYGWVKCQIWLMKGPEQKKPVEEVTVRQRGHSGQLRTVLWIPGH